MSAYRFPARVRTRLALSVCLLLGLCAFAVAQPYDVTRPLISPEPRAAQVPPSPPTAGTDAVTDSGRADAATPSADGAPAHASLPGVVQMIRVAPDGRRAWLDGEPVRVGQAFRGAQVLSIDSAGVRLRTSQGRIVRLTPTGIDKRDVRPMAPHASSKGTP